MKKSTIFLLLALLVLVVGIFSSYLLFNQRSAGNYPALIAQAFKEPRHELLAPGFTEVQLSRQGAYGIYYLYDPSISDGGEASEISGHLDCSLESADDHHVIQAAPDYMETNSFSTKDRDQAGVLMMSITVDKPGDYVFNCQLDAYQTSDVKVSLGPNYFWEFLHTLWEMVPIILGGGAVFFGGLILSMIFLIAAIITKGTK